MTFYKFWRKLNHEISKVKIKKVEEKQNISNGIKPSDIKTSQSTPKQEVMIERELLNLKNLNKEDTSNKKENDNDDLVTLNSKEKNIITIDLTNDEKIVFSQLGINPLIKLGKEYLTSNNFVRLKDESEEKDKILDNKKTTKQFKKSSKSKISEDITKNFEANENYNDKTIKKTSESEEVTILDKKDEIELKDEINNARKKRRRSSASIE